ncbi:MAG: beta-ketoacyl-[acyl-carrier-protein] synthase family protein [Armatimonadetes bacterium]|nr:beta-ketoacyl-[acyl-carrier-protein] synthase family protein [Armatimonadota bacterium]
MNQVVVTGVGAVSALGVGRDLLWMRLLGGQSGLRPMQRFETTGLRNTLAGEVPEDEWAPLAVEGEPRVTGYARVAAGEALRQSRLRSETVRVALVVATNFGAQDDLWMQAAGARRLAGGDYGSTAQVLAREFGVDGPVVTLSNACSSGTQAVGHAADLIRYGLADAAIAVGTDELGLFCLSGLSILHTITTDTIRPFDVKRSGTIFGEGAGAVLLESVECAAAREATALALVLGYGVTNNAYHMTAPDKGGEGMVVAMRRALDQAGIGPERIGHVNAHATGTEHHDPAETAAVKTVLGDHAYQVPVSAIKGATGHAMGAAGALEAVVSIMALRDQVVPPTLGLDEPDPACDLDCVPGRSRPAEFDVVLSVSAGLGGNNAAVLLGRC